MDDAAGLVEYYSSRAAEYERVYRKPERQADLSTLRSVVRTYFAGARVLEIACGTGYWTEVIAPVASFIVATDKSPEVLKFARAKGLPSNRVKFEEADAFDIGAVEGDFDSCFAGFWWSHVPRGRLEGFLLQLHQRLGDGARVMFLDNRYVEGSSTPIARIDGEGNTYQRRRLEDGSEYEVLKNFPSAIEIKERLLATGARNVDVVDLDYFWYACYDVAIPE